MGVNVENTAENDKDYNNWVGEAHGDAAEGEISDVRTVILEDEDNALAVTFTEGHVWIQGREIRRPKVDRVVISNKAFWEIVRSAQIFSRQTLGD